MTEKGAFAAGIERFLLHWGGWSKIPFDQIARKAIDEFGPAAPSADEIATFICKTYRGRSIINRLRRDRAMASWVLEHSASGTVDDIRAACPRRFGAARTPSRTRLAAFLRDWGRRWWTRRDRQTVEPEIAVWIRQEAPRRTIDALRLLCIARFGIRRTPSRTVLHRHLQHEGLRSAGPHWRLGADKAASEWLAQAVTEMTLTHLSRAMAARFGEGRARSRSTIQRHLASIPNRSKPARLRPLGALPDIAAWVSERIESHTLDELRAGCVDTFGADRTPSRSSIHRFIRATRIAGL